MSTRYERVVLDLEDRLSPGMAKAAASTALLNRELGSLSRDSVRTRRSVSDIDEPIKKVGNSSGASSKEVDKLSGRMRILADVALILGPSLIPIGAVGVPAIAAMAAQLGFAAGAAGTAVLAFQGIGNTLKALNTAALDPTTANLEKAQIALEGLSPAAQHFVAQLGSMIPELHKLRDVAATGLFPGLTVGLKSMETALPHVQGVIAAVSNELGTIAGDAGASLASSKWTDFLDFFAQNAPKALGEMASAAGHTAHAVAALWMATDPLNDNFSQWLVNATTDLDRWATGLSKTQGFSDFLAYVDSTGPKVAAAFGAIANAALQILQAAAPLGGPVLDGIKALADVVSALANSDIGTPLFTAAAGLALFNRALAITGGLQKATFGSPALAAINKTSAGIRGLAGDLALLNRQSTLTTMPGKGFIGPLTQAQTALGRVRSTAAGVGKTAALVGGIGLATSGAADATGLNNTLSLGLTGTFIAPGIGTAIGAAAGLMLDATKASKGFEDSIKALNTTTRTADFSNLDAQIANVRKQLDDIQHTTGVGDFFSDQVKSIGHALSHPLAIQDDRAQRAQDAIAGAQMAETVAKSRAQQAILRDGFAATATGIDLATQSALEFKNGIQSLNDTLAGRASLRDYEQALIDFTKRAADRAKVLDQIRTESANHAASVANFDRDLAVAQKAGSKGQIADIQTRRAEEARSHEARMKDLQTEADNLKNSVDITTQAGINTQALLDNIVATGVKFAESIKNPAKRSEFLAGVRSQLMDAAKQAGYSKDQIDGLLTKFDKLNTVKAKVKIVVDADGAYHVIDVVAARLERLTRKTYKLNIKAQAGAIIPQVLDAQAHAAGGTVRGPRYPYGDKVLALLAPGEEVITNRHGEADRFRADRSAGRIPAYADGGMVTGSSRGAGTAMVRFSDHDIDRIAGALAAARPNHGDVHINGDPTVYRREMQTARRRSSSDGYRRTP